MQDHYVYIIMYTCNIFMYTCIDNYVYMQDIYVYMQCSIQDWQRGGHFWLSLYRFGGHLVKVGDKKFFKK